MTSRWRPANPADQRLCARRTMRVRVPVALAAFALLGLGCGPAQQGDLAPPRSSPTSATSPTPSTRADAPSVGTDTTEEPVPDAAPEDPQQPDGVLTEDDDGGEVTLAASEERPLRLSGEWDWSEPRIDGAAVTLTPVSHLVDPGFTEWLVLARSDGVAHLEVDGEPACGDPGACPARTVRIRLEVGGADLQG